MKIIRIIEYKLRRFRMIVLFTLLLTFLAAMRFSGDANYFRFVLQATAKRDSTIITAYNRLDHTVTSLDTTLRILNSQRYADRMINNNEFRRLYETDSLLNQKINFYGRLARTNAANIETIKHELNKGANHKEASNDPPEQPKQVERSLQIAKGETILMREWIIAH